eukprot:scaffold47064_cov18-Tisochrysis_lutea.AAC.1
MEWKDLVVIEIQSSSHFRGRYQAQALGFEGYQEAEEGTRKSMSNNIGQWTLSGLMQCLCDTNVTPFSLGLSASGSGSDETLQGVSPGPRTHPSFLLISPLLLIEHLTNTKDLRGLRSVCIYGVKGTLSTDKRFRPFLGAYEHMPLSQSMHVQRPVSPNLLPFQPHAIAPQPKSPLHPLCVEPESRRDGLLFIPSTYDHKQPSPLILMLHGSDAKGTDCKCVGRIGITVLSMGPYTAVSARPYTAVSVRSLLSRDVIRGGFGADVQFINRALQKLFGNFNIDSSKICCAGFSDGASMLYSPIRNSNHRVQ